MNTKQKDDTKTYMTPFQDLKVAVDVITSTMYKIYLEEINYANITNK